MSVFFGVIFVGGCVIWMGGGDKGWLMFGD